ncbi:MAG: methionyl-tRNA formyltransferase [bacterium]
MRIIFIGTDAIGEIALRELIGSDHHVAMVITPPDRPKGRGRKIEEGPVKLVADEAGISVIQPESMKDESIGTALEEIKPDIITVVSYGEYIPSSIFTFPPHGSINLHPSLLPRWRGASPMRYVLLEGDSKAGVTVQYVEKKMDAGDILLQKEVEIGADDDHGALADVLYPLGAELLLLTLKGLQDGSIIPRKQDPEKITYAPKITKEDLVIDWNQPAVRVRNKIRAFSPSPGAVTIFRGEVIKLLSSDKEITPLFGLEDAPGTVAGFSSLGPRVICPDGILTITGLQPAGKKRLTGRDFVNGYKPEPGERLGESPGGGI